MNRSICNFGAVLVILLSPIALAGDDGPVAWWSFDQDGQKTITDRASGIEDRIEGRFKYTAGVRGKSLKLDGYTTCIDRNGQKAPALGDEFTISAWVAQGAYPWNFCPVVTCQNNKEKGYSFTVGPQGQFTLEAAIDGKWQKCESKHFLIPLRKWAYIVGTYDKAKGFALYINGKQADLHGNEVTALDITGKVTHAKGTDLRIGMNYDRIKPSNIHREHGTLPGWFSVDGILDEIKIYDRVLTAKEIADSYTADKPSAGPDLQARKMPSGPKGPGRFGAYYTHLKYYDEWDDLWAVGPDPDVVVRFDTSGARLVFWRGSRYSAAWVSENDLWMADQSVEAWGVGKEDKEGCFEHMQDRRCRYSHVRVIESNDARVVVHWRYAPVSSYDHLWKVDEKTGRACWVDEYYYIYPDQTAIRKVTWKTGTLGRPRQFQESLPFTHHGQLIGDVIDVEFATVGNLKGETAVLKFMKNPKKKRDDLPDDLVIQQYNFLSNNKPFIIFEPGNRMNYVTDRRIGSRGLAVPGACNHWPVGQALCDGRTVQAADRPTHFLGFPISYPPIHEKDGRSWWNGLYGMRGKTVKELAITGRSWSKAPKLVLKGKGFTCEGYDMSERAYKLSRKDADSSTVEFELAASEDSPIANAAFVIRDWGDTNAQVYIDGKLKKPSKSVRLGHNYTIDGTDLAVWLKLESFEPMNIKLVSKGL